MGIKINLIGQIFGRLTVLSRVDDSKFGSLIWNCMCSCGKNTVKDSHSLRSGRCKSCGCLREGFLDKALSSKNNLYLVYKKSAKKRGFSFSLSFEEIMALTQQNCYYCGSPPNKYFKAPSAREGTYYNGVDRIDNDQGYERNNSITCCTDCNKAKSSLNKEEFLNWIKKCYNYLKKNNMLIKGIK
jgi:hypothetical protein